MRNEKSKTNRVRYESSAVQPLVLDLIGPMIIHLYRDPADGVIKVGVYAPKCEDHHANLLTDSDDFSLEPSGPEATNISYSFGASNAPAGADTFNLNNSKQILLLSTQREPVAGDNCHMVLNIPCPNQIWPLISEHVWIHKGPAKSFVDNPDKDPEDGGEEKQDQNHIVNSLRARGLRFVYDTCNGNPILVQNPQGHSRIDLSLANPEAVGFNGGKLNLPHYHMTVRFASNRATADEHHEDAFNCFQTLRNTLDTMPPVSKGKQLDTCRWRVDFSDIPTAAEFFVVSLTGKRPNDCGSQTMVVQDPEFDTRKKTTESKPVKK